MKRRRRVLRWILGGVGGVVVIFVVLVLIVATKLKLWPHSGPAAPYATLPAAVEEQIAVGRLVFDSDRTGNFEVYTSAADGTDVRRLTANAVYDSWWGRISPDRRRVLFYRTPKGVHDRDYGKASLWVMNADGSNAVELRPVDTDGWRQQGHAEWSPDGSQLVMFGGSLLNPQIYVTSATGAEPRNLSDRGGTNLDPSWSPDGTTVVFVGCPRSYCKAHDYEIFTVPAAGGDVRRLTTDSLRDQDPYYSPDGGQVAWLTEITSSPPVWDIRLSDADGGGVRRVVDDDAINSRPEWSRDGSVIYFHRLVPGRDRFQIFSIAPDGTGLREITEGQPGVNEYPST